MKNLLKNILNNKNFKEGKKENTDLELLCGLMIEAAYTDGNIDESELNKIKINKLSSDYKSKKIISYERTIKRAWNTKDLSKTGIIGNPTKSYADKGKRILDLTSRTLKKIINEMK